MGEEAICWYSWSEKGEWKKVLKKLHEQYRHPRKERLRGLLEDADKWEKGMEEILDKMDQECTADVCVLPRKRPARPVVALPRARRFNQVVTMDLVLRAKHGEMVSFWRYGDAGWRGPGRVVASDDHQVSVRIGNQKYDCRHEDCIAVGEEYAKLKSDWYKGEDKLEDELPVSPITILPIGKKKLKTGLVVGNGSCNELGGLGGGLSVDQLPLSTTQPGVSGRGETVDEETVDEQVDTEVTEPSTAESADLDTIVQDAGQLERAGVNENNLLMARAQVLRERRQKRVKLDRLKKSDMENKRIDVKEIGGQVWTGILRERRGKEKTNKWGWWVEDELGKLRLVDLVKDNWEWRPEEVFIVILPRSDHFTEDAKKAKVKELELLIEFDVYEEENYENLSTEDQKNIVSTTWVVTEKDKDDKKIIKARLCARGFEEKTDFRRDSPTISKRSLRIMLAVIVTKGWRVKALDARSAFLQGTKIERKVYVKPPPEAERKFGSKTVWLLKKCLYGLGDAPRSW